MMRRGEACIDWIVHSSIHEDNKLSLLTSACPASFPLSSHSLSSLSFCLFWPLWFPSSLLAWFLSGHSRISLFDFLLFINAVVWLVLLPLNNTLSQNKSQSRKLICLSVDVHLRNVNLQPPLPVTLAPTLTHRYTVVVLLTHLFCCDVCEETTPQRLSTWNSRPVGQSEAIWMKGETFSSPGALDLTFLGLFCCVFIPLAAVTCALFSPVAGFPTPTKHETG